MNLNKFTKAELISKLQNFRKEETNKISDKTQRIRSSWIKTYFTNIWELFLTFKNILVKLTLISFFIQIFKKYKLFRRLWFILNTIIVSIFSISLIDNFGFDFINNFFIETKLIFGKIIEYLSNTHFYNSLNKLFGNEIDKPSSKSRDENKSMIKEISWQTDRDQERTSENIRQNNRNSKISEWLKPEVEPENEQQESEVTNYRKYLIIMGLLTGSVLVYIYFDDIKTNSVSLWEWFNSFRSGGTFTFYL